MSEQLSLKCKTYGKDAHAPCSGTTDDGRNAECKCWCHQQPAIQIQSGVSSVTGDPFVTLRWGKEAGQLTPEEAEQHATAVLAAAVASRIDAATWAELRDPAGLALPQEVAARFLMRLRERVSAVLPQP